MQEPKPRVWKVTVTKVITEEYQAIAPDEKGAEEAVYWLNSSGRPLPDARRLGEPGVQRTWSAVPLTGDHTCECGHFYEQHTPTGCGWSMCECARPPRPA